MRCTQCDGFMVSDNLIDLRESYQPMWMRGWRCIACGNIVDPLILRHRAIQEQGYFSLRCVRRLLSYLADQPNHLPDLYFA